MIGSKATVALMRLKAIDKKYKARFDDQKEEQQSSDNTESVLDKYEYKNNAQSILTKGKEILKPTLNIKIPDTYIEQLESHSTSSNLVSHSLRVSIVEKSPIATPKVQSQPESEIQEQLNESESIAEVLEDSNHSDSNATRKSHEKEFGKPKAGNVSLPTTVKSLSPEKKTANNRGTLVEDVHSNDYSHDSFETYSSIAENLSSSRSEKKESNSKKSSLKSNTFEGSILVSNTENNNILLKKKGTTVLKLTESTKKENKDKGSKITGNTDESDDIGEELSMSVEITDSKLDIKTTFKDTKISGEFDQIEHAEIPQVKLNFNALERRNEPKNRVKSISTIDENLSDQKSRRNQSDRTELVVFYKENQEKSSSTFKASNTLLDESGGSTTERNVSEFTYESKNEQKSSSAKNEKFPRVDSSKNRRKNIELKDTNQEKSVASTNSSPNQSNSSSKKLGRDRSKSESFKLVETENEESLFSSPKESNSTLESCDNNKTALFVSGRSRKQTTMQLLQSRKKHTRKSSDYPKEVGSPPESDAVESESGSRGISSRVRTEHRAVASQESEVEKVLSTNVDATLQSVIGIETTKKRKNSTIISRKSNYKNSNSYKHIHSSKNRATTSKSSVLYRLNGNEYRERKDIELERLKMRMTTLRLEQERQLLLRYLKDFDEDRESLILWPDRLYCPGKSEVSVIKPLSFPTILNFIKPAPTPADNASILPDYNLTILKDRVVEIRQWLKDQYILYQDYSDVASAINVKYSAVTEEAQKGNNLEFWYTFTTAKQ